jgi:hypothetical protein
MRRLFAPLFVAVMAAGTATAEADTAADAKKLGDLFCVVGKSGRDGGVFGRLYLVTRALGAAIDEAVKKNDVIAADKPGEKPPLGDGVPFQSLPDKPQICHAGKFSEADGKLTVEIEYIFSDTPEANWTDRLVLVKEDGRLRIDDVLYGTDNSGDGLRKALVELFGN